MPLFDYKTERNVLEALPLTRRPTIMLGDFYRYKKSGLVLVETYSLKSDGKYTDFPCWIVVVQGYRGESFSNAWEVGYVHTSFQGMKEVRRFTKLPKHEYKDQFIVMVH